MQTKKISFNSTNGVSKIHAQIFKNKNTTTPKGVIQIIHGMWEHTNRYKDFAKFYTDNGYIVAVHDHLGHGNSISENQKYGHFANENGDKYVIKDAYKFTKFLKETYPDLPHFIYAHSMGGLIAINMLSIYKIKFDGLILLGSHMSNKPSNLYYLMTKGCMLIAPPNRSAKSLTILQHAMFGVKFVKSNEGKNWVHRRNDYVKNANFKDPDPFFFTYSAFLDIFNLTRRATPEALSRNLDKTLPIYLLTGSEDPVTNFTKFTYKKYYHLSQDGFNNLKLSIYHGARHNLINELNRDEVLSDMLQFFDDIIDTK